MTSEIFSVAEECIKLGLRAGVILFRNVQIGPASPALQAESAAEAQAIRAKFAGPQTVRSNPAVIGFRDILRKVGVNPRKEQPSVERLLTFALKRGQLPAVNSPAPDRHGILYSAGARHGNGRRCRRIRLRGCPRARALSTRCPAGRFQ